MSQGFSFKEATAPVAPASSGGFSFEEAVSGKQVTPAAEPEPPSFPVGTMGGFEEAIVPIDRRSILDRPVPMPPAPPQDELLGINPQMVRAIKAQLDAAPPEKRQAMIAKLQNRGGVYGRIASSIASQYETIDRLPDQYRFIPKDFRSEVQAARFMAREGMTPEGAQSAAISQALIQAPLQEAKAIPLTEAQAAGERFKFEPGMAPIEETLLAIGRVGAKGGAAILQGYGGIIRFLGDAAGMDTRDTTKTLSSLNAFTQSMGEAKGKPLQIIEDAGTSIVQQLPALVGGTITGSQPLVLGSMFITSFGQTYDDSRRRKLDIGDATARAAMFAALEVVGEKFGLGDVLKGIKASAQGKPTGELANYFARALAKEVPGEQLTYAGQFAVDKGFGLNPEAGLAEFFKGAADTLAVTLAQGGMMMGGGAAISKASQKINQIVGRPPEQSFDYEALAKAKGFLAEQAPPPERPPAAPAVEPPAPAPEETYLDLETRAQIQSGVASLDPDLRDLWALTLERKLEKKGSLTWQDVPQDLNNAIDTVSFAGVKKGLAINPRQTIDLIRGSASSTTATPITPAAPSLAEQSLAKAEAPAPIVTEAAPPVQPPRTTRRVEEEEFETLPPTEVPETPPEEPVAAQPMEPPAVERTPASFAADIAAGKKLETPEDIQFYRNNAKEIEDEFIKLTAKVPPTKPIKDKEEPVDQHGVSGLDIIEVPINQLTLSKDVPQFKLGATDKGIVEPLGGKFERTGVAPIQVWRRTDGSLEIISGRHRFDLAKRSGETTIPAQIHDEAQGFDKIQAATLDAELNIRDGQGKVKDYVNYFKESGIDRGEAESKGLLARAIGKRSFTIANQGSEELIAAVRGDQVGDEAAYYIALNAPNDSRLQNVGIQAVMDGKSMNVAVNTMQAVKALASENDTTTDMFGFDDSAIKEAEAMARIASQKQREIQTRLSAISGAAKNPAVAKAEGIDIRNPEQVNRRIEELRAKKAAWDNWSTNPTLIAEIRAARGVEAPALAPREEPVLTTQTKEELQEKERREREIEERKRQEELEAKRKEEADKEREGFVLTGSDREADEAAARGQQDIFGAAPEPKNAPDENDPGFIGASDKEVEDVARAFDRAKEAQEDEGVTRVFDAPKKADVVRMEDKARIYVADAGYLTVEQAKQRIEEWKKRAESQGDNRANSEKIVLSLFDMTGEWSKPWEEAGYQVYRFDIQTDPEMGDVNKFSAEFFNDLYGAFEGQDVYAVLAACPCTDFASSGARHFAAKDADGRTVESVELVHQTLRTVEYFKPSVWAIENPVGRIEKLTGLPPWRMSFNPNHFGDPYTKKTLLWGRFNADLPIAPVEPTEGSKMHRMYGGKSQATKNARSVTPEGFAYAFFMANNAIDNPVMALANKYDMMDRAVFKAALDAGLSEKQITDIVNDPYYFSQDYKQAEADLRSAIETAAAPAPAPAPEAKTLPSFSKSVDELTPEEREAELRFIRSELSTLTRKYITSENEQEEKELEKIIDPLQERLNRLTKKGRLVEQKKKKDLNEATKVADEYETPMEVANGKTPDPALPPANRLILMPCSDMKGKTAAPAIDLYRGVFFQTIKTHAKDGKMPNVVILSAKHGIMNSNQIVEPYDQKMTPEQANILIASLDSQLRGLNIKNIDDVLIVGGKEYKKVMRLAVRKLLENGVINPEASINETTGELGEQRKQLREYMEAIEIAPVVEEKVEPVVEEKVVEEKKDYTPEQRKQAQVHADETGGEIVWQKGDYALIRGYSILSGDPVYVATMGSSRARTDIENFTGKQISDDVKREMIEAKNRLEKEAQIKHENKPFIVFDKGVSISKDISPELAGVIQGWKNLLKLDVDVYVSTIDDAKANRNNFTGPHRRIGSGTLDANERGSMRRMSDGSYYILFDKSTSTTRMLEVIAHEMGHLHQRLFYDRASPEEKQALQEAHLKWVEKQKGKSAKELVEALRARTTAQTTPMPVEQRADELSSYWTSFGEWYADQTSRWALSKEQPVGIVEKFFKRLGNQLRLFYQRLQNQKWLPDETFAQYIEKTIQNPIITQTQIQEGRDIDKASKMSSIDESAFDFGDEKVVKEIVKRSPLDSKARSKANDVTGPVKKLTKGRSPELAAAAQQVMEGRMSKAEFDSLVNKYRPIHPFAVVPVPATEQQVFSALASNKRPFTNPEIDAGTEVGLRLDIPAFNQHNVMVVAIHEKRTPSSVGTSIGYASTAIIRNVTFGLGNQKETLRIAAGKAKDSLQTMEGKYVESTPSETYELAKEVFSNPQWIQIGFDPVRHSYFWDRRTTMPVVKADVVIQIGNFILAKNPTYATKEEFLFDIASPPTKIYQPGAEVRKATRLERIQILSNLRAARTRLVKKVIAGEATIDTQRQLTALESLGKDIKQMLDMTKEPSITPEAFLSRALKAYDDGDISADVLAVIQAAYIKQPELLNGLRLSVRKPGERETGAAGTFQTITRIVTLFKGTGGVELPGTIRHELSHSLEQMMTAKQRKVVFDAWMKAFEKAIKTNTDQKAQAYFEAVIAYISDPNEATFKAAAKLLPSRDLYQFISPSEYWAVNAEPLMRQQLGSAWDRFKMAVRRLFEGLKAVFGFDNTYYVHKVFAQVMGGSKERLDRKSIDASLISSIGISFDTLRDLDDVQDLIDKYNRPKTPMIDQTPVKTFLVKQKEASKEFIQEAVQDPAGAINTLFDGMNRQLLNARNKNVWYGTALNAADTLRYNNSLRTSNDLATSSLALDNAIRGGHISAEVVFLGGLEFNDNSLMYTAVKRDLGMVGVYKAEKEIKDRLGDQLGTDLIQGYLEAKRSRSIENEFIFRANELEEMTARLDLAREVLASARKRKDQELVEALEKEVLARNEDVKQARADLDAIEIARGKINMSEEEIDEFISMDVDHPELRDILKNFNAVNQNLLRVWREVGLLSQARYEALSNIKDYVPWNRIMSDEDDLHSPVQATTRSRANIAKEKLFKKGKPTVITSFTTKEGEQVYRIQPTSTLQVTLNGEVLSPELYDAEVNGKVTINVPLQDGDDLVFEGNREIENIIDNMTRSVMRMTMNAVSKYAANTIVREYATRDAEGKIRTYPKPEQERGRFYFIVNGRRVVVEIKDPLLAEAIFGMRNVDLAMIKPLQAAANMTRRFITTDPMFQLFQLFKDAPLAGLISGVKNPFIVYANVFASFAKALVSPTVVAATKKLPGGPIEVAETMRILRAAGIGGYYQQSRTAEAEVKRRIGIMNNNVLSWVGKALDHIGDASDYAQRMAIYDRIMSETGDEALALYQAANVLNFLRHGSGQIAQILVKTVPFANAYANSTDVLFQAMAGGGLKGRSRKASIALFFSYGSLLAATTLLYVMLVGDDEEYLKLDDQTKLRHYIIPGTDIKLPMNTSAAFFFKALPEALYNAYINAATKDETDAKRLRTALKEAAADMLLGPEPVPSAIKPFVEIGLNRNFFTGRNVVPKNLEDVEAAEQYLGTTSEAGKFLSSLTGTDKTRLLNPIEADHIIRGLFGSVGAMAQWASNVLTDAAEAKPTPEKKDLPMVGRLFLPEVARGHEEWFYNFKKDVDKVWNTYQLKVKREKYDEAEAYLDENEETLKYHATVMMLSEQLQKINASIKYFETSVDKDLKPDERREEINEAKRLKQEVLEDIARIRKDHELEVEEAEKERKKAK